MNPKFKPISIEILVTIFLFLFIFSKDGLVGPSLDSLLIKVVLLVFVIEFLRILYKLHKLSMSGVDIDDEGMKSPFWYLVKPKVGESLYKKDKFLKPVYWTAAIIFSFFAIITVVFVIVAVILDRF